MPGVGSSARYWQRRPLTQRGETGQCFLVEGRQSTVENQQSRTWRRRLPLTEESWSKRGS